VKRQGRVRYGYYDFGVLWVWGPVGIPTGFSLGYGMGMGIEIPSPRQPCWFASRCPCRRFSTWPTTAVSCPTALGALFGQLTFRLTWCREHSVVMVTELFQPRHHACRTLFQSSCVIPTSPRPTDCSDDS